MWNVLNIWVACTCEIKSRIAMAKAAFNKKKKEKTLFTSTLDLNLRKKLENVTFGAEQVTCTKNRKAASCNILS